MKKNVLAILSLSALTLITTSISLSGCALFEASDSLEESREPQTEVIAAPFDEVWRAAKKVLASYPIEINNSDEGVLQTELIKGPQIWRPPFKTAPNKNIKYAIRLNVVKGKLRGEDSTRVTIKKSISLEKDFFSGEKELPSDGLEEKTLLYRIEREIQLERSLKRAFERGHS